ncbi:hypothetical protein [Paenibacillus apiarius]|uniref:hypothetical protein n=1 Tax=Paenibacillus apiarius TaxID=46240 RepID=UPI003B3BC51E
MSTLRTIKMEFPLYDTNDTLRMRLQKVHEELAEVAFETADGKKVNILKVLLEAQDVMQTAIGLAYDSLARTIDPERAVAVLEVLLNEVNQLHIDKIERYKEEQGWKAL